MSLKVAPHETNEDLCKTSIDILMEKCTDWFRRKEINGALWFADSAQPFPYRNDQTINIILFGGFLRRFLESGNWDFSNARFWVLSSSVKDILSQLLGISSDHIGVIPRYELFPTTSALTPFSSLQEPTTFVFAGRISAVKNIKMLLETVSSLQTDHNCAVQLALIGNYDNQTHSDRGRFDHLKYQEDIEALIQQLPWKFRPSVTAKVGPYQWPLMKFTNPVYVNLSTFMCEDFDVSTAQAQSQGWPCLLSDWGGHQDVLGKNVIKIAPSCIAHDHEPSQVRQIKAKAFAKSLFMACPQDTEITSTQDVITPKAISQNDLDVCRRAFINKHQDGIMPAYREGLDHFADTTTGKKFFASYRVLFSGPTEQQSAHCLLINDLHHSKNPFLADAFSIGCSIVKHSEKPTKCISWRDLFAVDSLKAIATCDVFILPFFSEELIPMIEKLLQYLHPQKLIIYARKDLFTENTVNSLLPLRPQDRVFLYDHHTEVSEGFLAHS